MDMRSALSGVSVFAVVLAAGLAAYGIDARAQTAPPPRSIGDVLALLEQHKPDPGRVNRLREIVAGQPPDPKDKVLSRRFYVERGNAAGQLGMVQQQLADLREAMELIPQGDPERWAVYIEIGLAEQQAGNFATAMKMWKEAPSVAVYDGQKHGAWTVVSVSSAAFGDLAGAREAYGHAESLMHSLMRTPGWGWFSSLWRANAERARAGILRLEGKHADAEISYRRAIALLDQQIKLHPLIPSRLFLAGPLSGYVRGAARWQSLNLVPTLLEQGKYAEAELVARDSLKRVLEYFGKYSPEAGAMLMSFANTVFEQGRFDEASALAAIALEIYEKLSAAPNSSVVIAARRMRGATYVEAGKHAEADAEFATLREAILKNPATAERLGTGSLYWVYAQIKVGKTAEAVDQARRIYERQRQRYGQAYYLPNEARGFYAMALAADQRYEEALREYRVAIPALLSALSERTGEEGVGLGRALRLTRVLDSYIALMGHFASLPNPPAGLDPVAEAFLVSDAARGSTVQRALISASARASIRDPELAKLAREEQDSGQRVASLTAILVDLLARPPEQQLPAVIAQMRGDIEALRKQRVTLKREIEKRFPEYANLIDPKPVSLDAARRTLTAGEVLIVLYGTEDKTFVWAVPHEGAARFHAAALGRGERDAMVAALRRALDVGDRPLELFPQFDVAQSNRLFMELLAPIEPVWGKASSLLIVPHGSLGELPFGLLVTTPGDVARGGLLFEGYRKIDWLIRRAAVTQLPSINTLVSLRSVVRARAPSKAFAGFGDPIFDPKAATLAAGPVTRGVKLRSAPFADPAIRKAFSTRLSMLARLPDTAEEMESIAKALGASVQDDVFLGARASETTVKKMDLSDRRVLAFATHGLVPGDLDGLTQPALALSSPLVTGETDSDGLLGMDEILALKLNADWVVLSACNSASAGRASEEAVSGLGRAFFFAGARALLVSNWPVETVSAKLLTTDIFRRQAADAKLARAEALRQAMLNVMDNETGKGTDGKPLYSYAHPMFWAPFSLVGDGGRN